MTNSPQPYDHCRAPQPDDLRLPEGSATQLLTLNGHANVANSQPIPQTTLLSINDSCIGLSPDSFQKESSEEEIPLCKLGPKAHTKLSRVIVSNRGKEETVGTANASELPEVHGGSTIQVSSDSALNLSPPTAGSSQSDQTKPGNFSAPPMERSSDSCDSCSLEGSNSSDNYDNRFFV